MAPQDLFRSCGLLVLLLAASVSAEVIQHTFHVHDITIKRLCKEQQITTVNGSLPGPTIYAREGDTLNVHVFNMSPHNITIHWHGVFQLLSCWADGPVYINQCPIRPGDNYTYRFNITGQEGTLLWHAHSGFFRATVHGALLIRPKIGRSYPFPTPYKDVPIIIGEWFNVSVEHLENQLMQTGNGPNYSQGFTINGWLGDLYPCSSNRRRFLDESEEGQSTIKLRSNEISDLEQEDIYTLQVTRGKTYLLRIINAALNVHMFFKIANHNVTVVAVDAFYTNPYKTDIVVLSPGQTVDVLVAAEQPSGLYYMASCTYHPVNSPRFSHTTTTAILAYDDATTHHNVPIMPDLPDYHDTPTARKFLDSLTALVTSPFWSPVPREIDEHMFITVGLGIVECTQKDKSLCQGPLNQFVAASLNNVSFQLPNKMSILEAYYNKVDGIYTTDFPNGPPYKFNFTKEDYRLDEAFIWTQKGTKVKKLKYNATVEIVLQSTGLVAIESHPIHLHGFNFYVVGQGFGNFDPLRDREKFNLENPQVRNTIAIPVGGWAAIRFRANNPGVWYMHCHLEAHVPIGLATAFLVENGPTPSTTLPPPPADLPQC